MRSNELVSGCYPSDWIKYVNYSDWVHHHLPSVQCAQEPVVTCVCVHLKGDLVVADNDAQKTTIVQLFPQSNCVTYCYPSFRAEDKLCE